MWAAGLPFSLHVTRSLQRRREARQGALETYPEAGEQGHESTRGLCLDRGVGFTSFTENTPLQLTFAAHFVRGVLVLPPGIFASMMPEVFTSCLFGHRELALRGQR